MASSPMSARSASPEMLSPGAKVRALMATVDSSDDENLPGSNQKSKRQRISLAKFGARISDSTDDDSETDIRPRGRLAARMRGNAASGTVPQSSLPSDGRNETRLSSSCQGEDSTQPEPTIAEASTPTNDDEDEMPVARRRLIRHHATPEPQVVAETSFDKPESPGLFVSSPPRPSPAKSSYQELDSDNEVRQIRNDRLQKLVIQKRKAREAKEEAQQAERRARQEKLSSEMDALASDHNDDISETGEDEDGHLLTQQSRPARKASKKAIEEMNRETQRMARNMQLAQTAKTRKKFETSGLLERFGFKAAENTASGPASSSRPATPETDSEMRDADTAPSSPPTAHKPVAEEAVQQTPDDISPNDHDELPSVDDLALETPKTVGKEKVQDEGPRIQPPHKPKRQIRVRVPLANTRRAIQDSDDELQIMPTIKDKVNAVFDNVPLKRQQEPHSLQALRALAQVKSPGKESARRTTRKGMTPGELSMSLQLKARQQARVERDRHVNALKAQGVVIQTAEEREREEQEVENILARARKDNQKLMEEERAAAKKEAQANGTYDPLAWDDSEDDDYEEPTKDGADLEGEADDAIDLSGSEEEEEGAADSENEEGTNTLFEDEADEEAAGDVSDGEATEAENLPQIENHGDEDNLPSINRRRGRNLKAILSDDEDDVIEATPKPVTAQRTSPTVLATDSPAAPGSVLRSAKKTFIPGLPVEGPAGLGLTQIFAGTMDDSQSQMTPGRAPTQSMMPDFDHFPDSNFSAKSDFKAATSQAEDTQASTQGVKFSLSQMRKLDSLLRGPDTQGSEIIEASQDGGFQEHTPLLDRFIEPPTSTVQTVLLDKVDRSQIDSPLVQRGRYRRKLDIIEETKDSESAFDVLRAGIDKERIKQRQEEFDRKKSKAREMVEEQADESEDEYAGLGGADGEDSDDESVASVKEMIDDALGDDVDKSKIAAFYADRERAEDEQGIEKLYKDLTTGQLRRKRGADYDLSDSDDGGEAQRRRKRLQFAKMQKALFADERVKKMAENPGNQAFLRTIEDQGDNGEANFLDVDDEPRQTQSDTATPPPDADAPEQTVPDSQPRRALGDTGSNRAPASLRRTKDGKRPSNIGDIRQTLSSLLEETDTSVIPATQVETDSENEGPPSSARSDKENRTPNRRRGRVAVVDRINLKRSSSSVLSASRLAFATNNPESSSTGLKVPSFLRRTSTSASFGSSNISSASSAMTGGSFGDDGRIKKNASKKSGINAFSATNDVMSKIEKNEKKRQEKRFRGAERRLGAVGGLLGKGSFE